MAEIIPAIIPQNYKDLEEHVRIVSNFVPLVQVDVTDGKFVQSKSWPYNNRDQDAYRQILSEDIGMPFWDTIDYEIDLMVSNPEAEARHWVAAGAGRIILHVESSDNLKPIIEELQGVVSIGLAVSPGTTLEKIYPHISEIDFVQFMGIKKIGFQGEMLEGSVLSAITKLRDSYPELIISVDGGVTLDNAYSLVKAGARRLVSGSAIYESGDIEDTIRQFEEIR